MVSIDSFARVLRNQGHRVTIFTSHHPEQMNPEEGVYRFPSVNFSTRTHYPVAIPIAPGEVRRMMADQHFDLIHSHSPMVMGHVAVHYHRRYGIPLIFTYHTLIEEYTHYIPLPQAWMRRRAIQVSREYSNSADHIIAPTTHVASRLRRYRVTKPITVIPTGIDIDLIDHAPPAYVRKRYDIPDGVPLLAYAGRMAIEKNIPRLLGAFRTVLRTEPDTHLLLIGGGPYEEELRNVGDEMGVMHRTRFTGTVDREQVIQGMREADLFVFASLTETQGLVLGEAMACGTPVVAVDADATREMIPAGQEGVLVPDDDAPFADAIVTLIRDAALLARMSEQARARAESLSAYRCTQRLLDVYYQVVGGTPPVQL
ncbi:MAG: glycosyltransferase [Armatimonadota bacterium]